MICKDVGLYSVVILKLFNNNRIAQLRDEILISCFFFHPQGQIYHMLNILLIDVTLIICYQLIMLDYFLWQNKILSLSGKNKA